MEKPKYNYRIVHDWLNKHYGRANKCENPSCTKKSNVFEYCLLKGNTHSRDRSKYIMLCRSCHRIYDNIDKDGQEIAKPIAGRYNHNLILGPKAKKKPVVLLPDNIRFESGKELADYLNADKSSVYMVLSGKRKSLYGKQIIYADN
jgi:hypothetical protein